MSSRPPAPYADAAAFYDLLQQGRGRDASIEAAVVGGEVRRRQPAAASLLDVACGTGVHLPHFAEQGFEVAGVDGSEAMLAIARRRNPTAGLVLGDLRTFDLGRRFDAVVCLFSGIGYLTDPADLTTAIATMAAHLEPGGVLAVEGWIEPAYWVGTGISADSATDPVAGAGVARAVRTTRTGDGTGNDVELFMRYVTVTPTETRTIDEHHVMRLSVPEEFEAAFRSAGLGFERLPHMLHAGRSVYVGIADL